MMSLTEIHKLLDKPKVIAVIGNINTGKSMLLYNIIEQPRSAGYSFAIYYYGLRCPIKDARQIYTVGEMELIRNSVIVVDELSSLFNVDDRQVKGMIENTLRLINHNNNILILAGTPENFKKFLGAKVDEVFYKTCTISDFINGSAVKRILTQYRGNERGSEVLNMDVDKALHYDGRHYEIIGVPYLKEYDSKQNNPSILQRNESKAKVSKRDNVSILSKAGDNIG